MKKVVFLSAIFTIIFGVQNARAQAGSVYTIAGGGSSTSDGIPATSEGFSTSSGICVDPSGNVYVMDFSTGLLRRIDAVTGLIYRVAGGGSSLGDGGPATAGSLSVPRVICSDVSGNIFMADGGHGRIRKLTVATGIISTVAGGGSSSSDGIAATNESMSPNAFMLIILAIFIQVLATI